MSWLRALAALAVLEAAGAFVLASIVRDARRVALPLRLGLSFGLGLFTLTLALFVLSLAGVAPAWWSGVGVAAIAAGVAAVARPGALRGVLAPRDGGERTRLAGLEIALLAMLACVFVSVGVVTVLEPIAEWDVISIWALKAKVLLHGPIAASPYFHDVSKAYSHLDYPLLWPAAMTWVWTWTGGPDTEAVKLLAVALLAALLLSFYGLARRRHSRVDALLFTALLAGVPLVLSQTSRMLADAPLAFFALLAFGSAAAWLDGEKDGLRLAGVFGAALVFTKNEGLALLGILAVALLAHRARWRAVLLWAGLVPLALASVWLLYRAGLPKLAEDYGARVDPLLFARNASRLPGIARGLARYALEWNDWLVFWPLASITVALAGRRLARPPASFLALSVALMLALYVAVYVVTPWEVADLLEATAGRLLLHVAPMTALLLADVAPRPAVVRS